jgi:MYXO-CTERM domain-containing protein
MVSAPGRIVFDMQYKRTLVPSSTLLWMVAMGSVATWSPLALALDPFTNGSSTLNNPSVSSGVAIGAWDMNNDGLDDIVRLNFAENMEIEYQQEDGSFTLLDYGSIQGSSWSLAIGDINNDGYGDIFTGGGYDGLKVMLATDDGTDYLIDQLPGPELFVQCSNFADIDDDGNLDLFICHDDGISSAYQGTGDGNLVYDPELIVPESTIPSNNSGNYGTVWTDYDNDGDTDLYIAKCRLGVNDPMDGRRLNLLFQNDGDNNYTDVAEAAGLRPLAQSWAADFGDIDNDGDYDAILLTHDSTSRLYENGAEGTELGEFTEITEAAGITDDLDDVDLGIQSLFEDFDNDGWIDILVTGRSNEHRLFINNGDKTFTAEAEPFPTDGPGVQSAAIGDFNNDGFPDVMAGFATGFNQPSGVADRLFLNPGNENNWINVRLTGVISNATGAGARVELVGDWGTQVREVRAGQGYGITVSPTRHFGIGESDAIGSLVVRWPSGTVDTIDNPPINGTVHIIEGCAEVFFADIDGDTFGDPDSMVSGCIPPAGYVADNTDCDDGDAANFPGNPEVCDDADNDCDEDIDEDLVDCNVGESSSTTDPDTLTGADTSGTTAGSATNDTATDGEGTSSSGPAMDGDGGGCGCDVGDSGTGALWFLSLLALPVVRRRRSA